jgi:excisionase family DNA binding protein
MQKVLFEINSKEELEAIVSKAIENTLAKTNSKQMELKDELLTTEELCSWLKLSRVTIWSLVKRKIIPYIRIGNQKRYQKSKVLEKLNEINHPKFPSYEG